MISNLTTQMTELGQADKLDAVLEEVIRVREELGFPIMVSPMSQFIAEQALFNVVHGERYRVIPEEIRNYALGWYGEPPVPLAADVLDRLTGGAEPIKDRPGALLEPRVKTCRERLGAGVTDEEIVLALHYKPKQLDAWRKTRGQVKNPGSHSPVSFLVKALSERPEVTYVHVKKGDFHFDFAKQSLE